MFDNDASEVAPTDDRLFGSLERISRYDLILATIPAVFLLSLLAAAILPISSHFLLAGAACVGALLLFDGIFLNPPQPQS